MIRVRVTKLKYAVACASSKPRRVLGGPQINRGPDIEEKGYHAIRDGVGTTNTHLWDPEGPCPGPQSPPCARVAVPGAGPRWGPKRAQNGPKYPNTGPSASVGGPRRFRCPS